MHLAGTVDRVCSGENFRYVGLSGEGPGYIAQVLTWDYALTAEQIVAVFEQTKSRYDGASMTCSDGVLNQDETGVDCGGATCSAARTARVFT